MFDSFKSIEEFYNTETENEYQQRKVQEYQELLKIKEAITNISKFKLYSITDVQKRKYICYEKCYNKFADLIFNDTTKGSQYLSECAIQCKQEMKDVKQFLKNVDKLVAIKNETCYKDCQRILKDDIDLTIQEKTAIKIQNLKCQWICSNKIDRRYRDFWLKQRNNIMEQHTTKQVNL